MPEDSKNNQHKHKNDPKEQRKPRQGRQQAAGDKKTVKPQAEASKHEPKEPPKPVPQEPGPDFYKGLKRETDEILKITEDTNSKYKKKEILSNWSKYEMPIESYEEIDEQNLGADYEKLVAAPLSIGGHFQFKHEKSWNVTSEPSLYDKYFDIDMENLAMAISTIPFYERNDLDQSLFTESDLLSMNHRSIKYKQQYFKDKSYTTPSLEAFERICNSEKEVTSKISESDSIDIDLEVESGDNINLKVSEEIAALPSIEKLDLQSNKVTEDVTAVTKHENIDIDDIDDILLINVASNVSVVDKNIGCNVKNTALSTEITSKDTETEIPQKNIVIESPEELEKWLDDFLET